MEDTIYFLQSKFKSLKFEYCYNTDIITVKNHQEILGCFDSCKFIFLQHKSFGIIGKYQTYYEIIEYYNFDELLILIATYFN